MDKNNIFKENGLYYYNTDEFATVKLCFKFRIGRDIRELVKARILSCYLVRTSKNYKSYKEIKDKLKYFYGMYIDAEQTFFGSENFFTFNVNMVSPRVIGEDYMKDAIKFVRDILLEPNFTNGKLDSEVINQVKKELIASKERSLSNPSVFRERLLLNKINPNSNLALNHIVDASEFKEVVESITDKDLIEFYNNTLSNFYRGYVFGDVNSEERNVISSSFSFKSSDEIIDYSEFIDICEGEDSIEHDTKQSDLYVVYKLNNYSLDKIHLYKVLASMLSTGNGLCHKVLRSELGLVYSSGAFINKYRMFGFLYLGANISGENKDKCLDGIDEISKRLKDKKQVSELLQYAKDKLNQEYYFSGEDVNNVIGDFSCYVFGTYPDKEELYKKINELSSDDIISEVDNIVKKYVFFGRGVK